MLVMHLNCRDKKFKKSEMVHIKQSDLDHVDARRDISSELMKVFKLYNVSASGSIDHFELLLALKELGITSCLYTTRRILESIDIDQSGAIEFGDFCEFFEKASSEAEVKKLLTDEAVRCLEYKATAESGDPNFARHYKIPVCQKPVSRYAFHNDVISGISWLDNEHFLATSLDGYVSQWRIDDPLTPLHSFKPLGPDSSAPIYSHTASDSKICMGLGNAQGFILLDQDSRQITFQSPPGDIMSVCAPDTNIFVTGSKDGHVSLFDATSTSITPILTRPSQVVQSVCAMSPSQVAVGFHSGYIDIVDIRSRQVVSHFEGCLGKLNAMACLESSSNLFTGGDDFIVRKFDTRMKLDSCEIFLGHSSPITALQIANGDKRLLSGSADGSVRVWDLGGKSAVAGGPLVKFHDTPSPDHSHVAASRSLIGHTQAVKCISVNEFEPNGAILTGSIDTSINCFV